MLLSLTKLPDIVLPMFEMLNVLLCILHLHTFLVSVSFASCSWCLSSERHVPHFTYGTSSHVGTAGLLQVD